MHYCAVQWVGSPGYESNVRFPNARPYKGHPLDYCSRPGKCGNAEGPWSMLEDAYAATAAPRGDYKACCHCLSWCGLRSPFLPVVLYLMACLAGSWDYAPSSVFLPANETTVVPIITRQSFASVVFYPLPGSNTPRFDPTCLFRLGYRHRLTRILLGLFLPVSGILFLG